MPTDRFASFTYQELLALLTGLRVGKDRIRGDIGRKLTAEIKMALVYRDAAGENEFA